MIGPSYTYAATDMLRIYADGKLVAEFPTRLYPVIALDLLKRLQEESRDKQG